MSPVKCCGRDHDKKPGKRQECVWVYMRFRRRTGNSLIWGAEEADLMSQWDRGSIINGRTTHGSITGHQHV